MRSWRADLHQGPSRKKRLMKETGYKRAVKPEMSAIKLLQNRGSPYKVKGSSQALKIGTKAMIKRIVEGKDHQLDCKVDGAGEMMVTAKFVKKA